MSLHADVTVPARDRQRLERLCRYVARPPLALARLESMSDGRLADRLETPWRDGTTHVVMERRDLLERLAPLIPPPRAPPIGPATPDGPGPLKPSTADEPTLAEIDDDPDFDFDQSESHGWTGLGPHPIKAAKSPRWRKSSG